MMIAELICAILSCSLISLYLTAVIMHRGVPSSISATYYSTEKKWLMPACLFVSGALALIPILNNTPEEFRFTAFFIIASIFFVACAPAFKEDLEGKVHTGAAIVFCLSSMAWLILSVGFPWLAVAGIILGCIYRKQFLFWVEVGLLYNIYVALFYIIPMNV